jgi:NADH-quinone oxidoreductase subunit N
MVECIYYAETFNMIKIMSLSDILFLICSMLLLLLTGSYLTLKNKISLAFGKTYALILIYIFILFIIITINLNDIRLFNVDDSFMSSIFVYDFFSRKFLNLLMIFALIFILTLYSYIQARYLMVKFEYIVIVLISLIGLYLLLTTKDLFFWFLAIELQSFCFYALSAYRTNRSYLQTEAGLKYFLFGSLASSLYLFGISIIYLSYGSLNLETLATLSFYSSDHQMNIGLFLIFVGLSFKLGIAPFHFWVPLVYTYSSSIVTYLFILLPKIPLFYLLLLLSSFKINNLLYIALFMSIFIGSLFAFKATNLKTFFAYSAIANNAFFIAPLINPSIFSFYSFIFYIFSYNIIITILFYPILFTRRSDYTVGLTNLRDFILLKKTNIALSIVITLAIISLAGVPPFIGFFSKFFILVTALSYSSYFIITTLLSFAVISAYYYVRLIKILYFSFYLKYASLSTFPIISSYIISLFTLINFLFIFFPTKLLLVLNIL